MRPTTKLTRLLQAKNTTAIMEAHSGLSARIVQEAGFEGIWASGLSISSSMGLRDNNEASWSDVLNVVGQITDVAQIPVLMDADSGFGNFNTVRRVVKKAGQIGVAGVCMEDKFFPKTNSFIHSEQQQLAPIQEFCGKIAAAKDSQVCDDFVVVARLESLIVGRPMHDALSRAHAYADAGADAILIHSKLDHAGEISDFSRQWNQKLPLIIVPTTYHQESFSTFEELNISLVIWANHLMRASIQSMQQTAAAIQRNRSVSQIEPGIATMSEVFRLMDYQEHDRAEEKYFGAFPLTRQ